MPDDLSTRIQSFIDQPHGVFHAILVVSLLATAVVIVVHLLMAFLGGRAEERRVSWTWWGRLVYLATLLSVATLGITAFVAMLRFGAMEGWWLFVHMFGAGALVALLPLLALTWCIPNRFGSSNSSHAEERDNSALRSWVSDSDAGSAPHFFWMPKVLFWLLLVSGLAVCLTMLLSMVPLFGTEGLIRLLEIHRYAGLIAVVALALHLNCILMQRLGLR